jgi:hypothetical protein
MSDAGPLSPITKSNTQSMQHCLIERTDAQIPEMMETFGIRRMRSQRPRLGKKATKSKACANDAGYWRLFALLPRPRRISSSEVRVLTRRTQDWGGHARPDRGAVPRALQVAGLDQPVSPADDQTDTMGRCSGHVHRRSRPAFPPGFLRFLTYPPELVIINHS